MPVVGRQEGHLACNFKKSGVVWFFVWGEVQLAYNPADATATHCLFLQ